MGTIGEMEDETEIPSSQTEGPFIVVPLLGLYEMPKSMQQQQQ